MKKLLLNIAWLLTTISLAGCSSTPFHEHTFDDKWTSNELSHWHKATCEHTDLTKDLSEHTFNADGICSVCGTKNP